MSRPLPPSCPKHPGFIAASCQPCAGFPNEAASIRGIAAHRRKGVTVPTRSAFDVAAQERRRLDARDSAERALAAIGRKPKR